MIDALEDNEGTVSLGDRAIADLRLVDDIDGLAGEEEQLAKLVERLDKVSTASVTKISAEMTKVMTNNTSGINTEIKRNGQRLETVKGFKDLAVSCNWQGFQTWDILRESSDDSSVHKMRQYYHCLTIIIIIIIIVIIKMILSVIVYEHYHQLLTGKKSSLKGRPEEVQQVAWESKEAR